MKIMKFHRELRKIGYSPTEIMKLNRLGYESARDAHEGLEDEISGNFNEYCRNIGREFVLDNLDMFDEMIGRK